MFSLSPTVNANYHLDSYGLEPFQCLPLEGYDVRKRIISHPDKDSVRQASLRKALWRAAVIIPLLSLMVVVPWKTDFFKAKVESTTMNPLVTAEFENNKKAVDEGNNIEVPKAEEKIKPVPVVNEAPKEVIPVTSAGNKYFIITGSFKSKDNAESQVNMLKEEGFIPEIVTGDNGFYRVCAMICNDITTAVTKKDSISKKFPGTWVSKKR